MVDYQTWVRIVRQTAGRKGADLSEFETNSEIVRAAASVWNDKPQLKTASVKHAEDVAKKEVTVR